MRIELPVISEALGGQLDPSMSMTAAATPYMTHVKSSDPALSASGVTLKPLQVDLALIYNSDAAGGPGILSGTGMKTSTLTSSSWVLQKTSDVSGASNLGPFDSHYAFKGFWVPSGTCILVHQNEHLILNAYKHGVSVSWTNFDNIPFIANC